METSIIDYNANYIPQLRKVAKLIAIFPTVLPSADGSARCAV